jgi:hypothetical protein
MRLLCHLLHGAITTRVETKASNLFGPATHLQVINFFGQTVQELHYQTMTSFDVSAYGLDLQHVRPHVAAGHKRGDDTVLSAGPDLTGQPRYFL